MARKFTVSVKAKKGKAAAAKWELTSQGGPSRAARTAFKRHCGGNDKTCSAVIEVYDHGYNRSRSYAVTRVKNTPPLEVKIGGKMVTYKYSVAIKALGKNSRKSSRKSSKGSRKSSKGSRKRSGYRKSSSSRKRSASRSGSRKRSKSSGKRSSSRKRSR
jgi:hypothetical protein